MQVLQAKVEVSGMAWLPSHGRLIKINTGTSGQDGDISRFTLPPHTTKKRTTNLKTTTKKQNCQKIELYGNLKTKGLKKKKISHTGRRGGDEQLG